MTEKQCLWCKTPITEPFVTKKNEEIQACDNECAKGLKACERIEKNLGMIPESLLKDFEQNLFVGVF